VNTQKDMQDGHSINKQTNSSCRQADQAGGGGGGGGGGAAAAKRQQWVGTGKKVPMSSSKKQLQQARSSAQLSKNSLKALSAAKNAASLKWRQPLLEESAKANVGEESAKALERSQSTKRTRKSGVAGVWVLAHLTLIVAQIKLRISAKIRFICLMLVIVTNFRTRNTFSHLGNRDDS
jgi:hypothetical protein